MSVKTKVAVWGGIDTRGVLAVAVGSHCGCCASDSHASGVLQRLSPLVTSGVARIAAVAAPMMPAMTASVQPPRAGAARARSGAAALVVQRRLRTLWRVLHLGALVLALAISPSTYRAPWRTPLAAQLTRAALPLLAWFTLLAAILSLVIVRIVLVTAQSYGLSQFALEMVVRVLVVELIPLTAAFAVALQVGLPMAAELLQLRRRGALQGAMALRALVVPRALAGLYCVLLLAAVASAVALLLAYLLAHGFSPWGLPRFTRIVGQVFAPYVVLVFVLKTGALALAVAVLPIGSALHDRGRTASDVELQGLLRLFAVILAIEVGGLAGNYL